MKNRKNLHDLGLGLIIIGVLNLFMFVSSLVGGLVDGTINEALASVEPELLGAVKVVLTIVTMLMGSLVFADVFLGMKALNVSEHPTADKGYITAAKVFFVLSVIAVVSTFVSLFDGNTPIVDAILNFTTVTIDACIYFLFIRSAQAVRQDVLNSKK